MLRVLALDVGEKRIGIAVSDALGITAQGLETFSRTGELEKDVSYILSVAEKYKPVRLLFGLPRNMDGSEGPRAQSTRAFARNLERLTPLPISFWDERLSTVAAERALLEGDTSRKRRAEVIDQVAAGYILQGALDRLRHIG